jgi:hypothetical protein
MDILKIKLTTYGLRLTAYDLRLTTYGFGNRIPKDNQYWRWSDDARSEGRCTLSLTATTCIYSVILITRSCILVYLAHGTIYILRTISLEAHTKTTTNRYKMIILSTNNICIPTWYHNMHWDIQITHTDMVSLLYWDIQISRADRAPTTHWDIQIIRTQR